MPITRELVEFVRQKVAETPNILTAKLAAELGASEVEVITALPLHMRVKAKPDDFEAIWGVVRSWSETEVYGFNEQLLHNNANTRTVEMFDVKTIAKLQSPPPIKNEELGSIWFITKPQNGEEKNYVKFFDKNGHHLLTVCPLTEQ
ncbi:hypothetical protein LJB93_03425, partial [Desulfovibrio sp. OttesenSCG-928-F07]|nr:hypothetical protein [Desulfovibrio sp. OttesenSCG-928-F07]